jgi:integrase
MARPATGNVVEKRTKRGMVFAIRFPVPGRPREYERLGGSWEGWNRERAEAKLQDTMALVRMGKWRPPEPESTPEPPKPEPTFHEFASEWMAAKRSELRENSAADYEWALTVHLLPRFADFKLSEITIQEVDRYRAAKAREGRLSPATINKTLTRLAQILEDAVEYGLIEKNPARGRRRRMKVDRPRPVYLDTAAQIATLLEAASDRDGRKVARTSGRRTLIAVLVFAGLRVTEACRLRWRDIDLTTGRITVRESKTGAGANRQIDVLPTLRDELARYVEHDKPTDAGPDSFVFTTARGTPRDKDNVAARVIRPVIERADELLEERDEIPLPARLSAHKLRHTYASILAACGEDFPYVVDQMGHSDERVTLRVYTHMMSRRDGERERLRALVAGEDWREFGHPIGTRTASEASSAGTEAAPETTESPDLQGIRGVGATGLEPVTSSLSSWRSPN